MERMVSSVFRQSGKALDDFFKQVGTQLADRSRVNLGEGIIP